MFAETQSELISLLFGLLQVINKFQESALEH